MTSVSGIRSHEVRFLFVAYLVFPTHDDSFLMITLFVCVTNGEALKCLNLLTDTSITPKGVSTHALPVQSAPAEEVVRHQYPSPTEMTRRLSGY